MSRPVPRDYQLAAGTALWNHVHTKGLSNPLVVMPTGTGKSLTMALWVWGMLQKYPYLRVLNLTHVKELVDGNYRSLLSIWPTAPAGVYSAGLKRRDRHSQITYAGVGSFLRLAQHFGKVDFVLVDEAHRISDEEKSTYQKIFTVLRGVNPNLVVIGFTATDFRLGMGRLTEGGLFDEVCFDLSDGPAFVWMLEQKYLLKPVPRFPGFEVDESKVRIKAGEYDENSAAAAFRDQNILERAVASIIQAGEQDNRRAWLIFVQSIEDCDAVATMFQEAGYPVESVHSKRGDRDEVLAAFREGKLRGVVNKDILTTGFDDPRIDLIGVMRLTKSPGLWVQMLGRGTRPCWSPGYDISTLEGRSDSIRASHKQNCLVLDFAGNTSRLGPINYPTIPKKAKKGGGDPPVRRCPECNTYNHISLKCCEECGYEFPVEQKLRKESATDELVLDFNSLPPPIPKEMAVFRVDQMLATMQKAKPGKWPTLRVDYFSGVRRFSTWVCPEHSGYPKKSAERWWFYHGGDGPLPPNAAALAMRFPELTKPYYIKVWVNTKYPEIEDYDFRGTAFELPPELGGPVVPKIEVDRAAEAEAKRIQQLAAEMFNDDLPF